MDQLSVEQGQRRISVYRSRNRLVMSSYQDGDQSAYHEFTFDQLYSFLGKIKPGIQDILTK